MQPQLNRYVNDAGLELVAGQFEQLLAYAQLIAKWSKVVNLVGSASPDTIARTHIGDCISVVPFLEGTDIVDVGSGAGLPGLVIAIVRPTWRVTLVESRQRKCRFLRQAVIELGLSNTAVVAERIEQWRPPRTYDAAICRGYAALDKFFDDTSALHRAGLRLYAMKGVVDPVEIGRVPANSADVEVRELNVPEWHHRHLVTIRCNA